MNTKLHKIIEQVYERMTKENTVLKNWMENKELHLIGGSFTMISWLYLSRGKAKLFLKV